jgi:ribosomal protein S12 methylthiotransferase
MTKTTKNFKDERLSLGQKVGVINLGCARNLVDSQNILGRLKKQGHRIVEVEKADIAIVNTCSFIEEARKESIDTILDLVELKNQGKLKKVIVAGCLAQRYGKELVNELKGVDAFIGTPSLSRDAQPEQYLLTPQHFAYVKICESCFNACSFCAIPKIKGKFVSRTIESIVKEIQVLDGKGVREINIIGQDITAYGMDIYREKSLAKLLKELVKVTKNIQWIRLLYAFPAHVTDELIDVIASEPKITPYIDIPLQHISDPILKAQNRNITTQGTKDLISKMRTRIKDGFIRTTFIVGMPGETEEQFQELMDYVRTSKFERVGVFVYSKEEDTAAFAMPGHVPAATKRRRMNELMALQQEISKGVQESFVGRTLRVLIDEKQEGAKDTYLGRSQYDAPEVDGVVFVSSAKPLKTGDFVDVRITDAYEYDLAGTAL